MKALGYTLHTNKQPAASYLPDFTAHGIDDIDFAQLKKLGVTHLLFDLDQTLRRPYTRQLNPELIHQLSQLNTSGDFNGLFLVSNNLRNLKRFSEPIGARVFQPYRKGLRIIRKPNPEFFKYVLGELGCQPHQTVMIGDRLHADVLGGNRMGMYTLYVKKRGAIDYWFDWLLLTRMRDKRRLRTALTNLRKRKHTK